MVVIVRRAIDCDERNERNERVKRMTRRLGLAGALGAAALTATACGATGTAGGDSSAALPTGVNETVSLVATDFAYSPAQIKVSGLGELTIKLENKGQVEHDFIIDGLSGPKLLVKPKETGTATYKITKGGKFSFGCTVQGHKEAGMKGTLTVG
ncbi:MAG TPA: cupredoxin domain-containing protein [Chloroflexota bacterium]|nr:cupredoxin domain-containing protein [Chloroflexota bacterium]